jgi:serine palmitoyltransferase
MGTFTKSFGAMGMHNADACKREETFRVVGGYIAADKRIIDHLRVTCAGMVYHNSMSPAVCQQVLTAFKVIMVRSRHLTHFSNEGDARSSNICAC